jgi:hypothetical protein
MSQTPRKLWFAMSRQPAMVLDLFGGLLIAKIETALNCPASMKAGGHNNTEINPVFRGMVCPAKSRDRLLTKGNCD